VSLSSLYADPIVAARRVRNRRRVTACPCSESVDG